MRSAQMANHFNTRNDALSAAMAAARSNKSIKLIYRMRGTQDWYVDNTDNGVVNNLPSSSALESVRWVLADGTVLKLS
jgi:hypothetical protein